MALEEATDAQLPFGMGEVDLTSVSAIFAIIALTLGAMLWNVADRVGANLADSALETTGQYLPGGNPATSTNENAGPAYGGAA